MKYPITGHYTSSSIDYKQATRCIPGGAVISMVSWMGVATSQQLKSVLHRRGKHRRMDNGSIAEFPAALATLFFLLAFPLINLCFLGTAAACIYLSAVQTAISASYSQTFESALAAVSKDANYINTSGFARLVKMRPVNGYNGTGIDLFVQSTGLASGSQLYGPNTPVPGKVDTAANIYEYVSSATYEVSPFIDLSAIPPLRAVPGLGKPALLNMRAFRACEFPLGLSGPGASLIFSGGTADTKLSELSGLDNPGTLTDVTDSGWNNPTIYKKIAEVGQSVVQEEVLTVDARNPNWTITNLTVSPGQKIWIDYKATGTWTTGDGTGSHGSKIAPFNADGLTGHALINGFPNGAMIGQLGSSPSFLLGAQQWNMVPPGTGVFAMKINDDVEYTDNQGFMTVRVIVTE